MLQWVFFDLGGTLLDDLPFHDFIYKTLTEMLAERGFKVGIDDFIKARDDFVFSRVPVLTSLIIHFTGDEKLKEPMIKELMKRIEGKGPEFQSPNPGSDAVIDALHGRYRLGIIANQQKGIRVLLRSLGWDKQFEVNMISDDIGIWKPDIRIFQMALEEARCPPSQAVMVGDRIDNDVSPAKRLGMKTVRYKWGVFGRQVPATEEERPDSEVSSLAEVPGIISKLG